MNADPNAIPETDVTAESAASETELVELGAVSETQGSVYGPKPDTGVGLIFN